MKFALLVLLTVFAIASERVNAATITVTSQRVKTTEGNLINIDAIAIEGAILPGDGRKFLQLTATTRDAIIVLMSPGGSLVDAIDIGDRIYIRQYTTIVPDDRICASACALIWLAGALKVKDPRAKLGFHGAFNQSTGQTSGPGNALVGAYLQRLGLASEAIMYMTLAPPEKLLWLDAATASKIGIEMHE